MVPLCWRRLADAAAVDQRVVEAIVDVLDWRGWGPVTVVATGLDGAADGRTPRGTSYRLAEVHTDMTVASVPNSSVLHGRRVSTAWTQAALRIVLVRSATDLADGYAGCVDLLAEVVEPTAEATRADLAADVLEHLPATVAVVDALVTSRGLSGRGGSIPWRPTLWWSATTPSSSMSSSRGCWGWTRQSRAL